MLPLTLRSGKMAAEGQQTHC